MRTAALIILMAGVVFAGPANACDYPSETAVTIPDGDIATKDQMLEAKRSVTAYQRAMEEYRTCLRVMFTGEDRNPTPEEERIWTARHNASIDAEDKVAARFNEQVRRYKARERN